MFHTKSKSHNKLLYKMSHLFKVSLFLLIIVSVLPSAEAKICFEIDARNDPTEIEQKLRNCTIVVGSVSILLIEKHQHIFKFETLRFPELQWDIIFVFLFSVQSCWCSSFFFLHLIFHWHREITGFLLLFRVHGIKTFRYMFPNLKVIRGEKLKGHYSLIVYDVNTMTEVRHSLFISQQHKWNPIHIVSFADRIAVINKNTTRICDCEPLSDALLLWYGMSKMTNRLTN